MIEPDFESLDGKVVPLSEASSEGLRNVIAGRAVVTEIGTIGDEAFARDFSRRYAAILLRERGQ